jgi:hypothetical protein
LGREEEESREGGRRKGRGKAEEEEGRCSGRPGWWRG